MKTISILSDSEEPKQCNYYLNKDPSIRLG